MYDGGDVAWKQKAVNGSTGVGGAAYYGRQVFIKSIRPLPFTLITPLTSHPPPLPPVLVLLLPHLSSLLLLPSRHPPFTYHPAASPALSCPNLTLILPPYLSVLSLSPSFPPLPRSATITSTFIPLYDLNQSQTLEKKNHLPPHVMIANV